MAFHCYSMESRLLLSFPTSSFQSLNRPLNENKGNFGMPHWQRNLNNSLSLRRYKGCDISYSNPYERVNKAHFFLTLLQSTLPHMARPNESCPHRIPSIPLVIFFILKFYFATFKSRYFWIQSLTQADLLNHIPD